MGKEGMRSWCLRSIASVWQGEKNSGHWLHSHVRVLTLLNV